MAPRPPPKSAKPATPGAAPPLDPAVQSLVNEGVAQGMSGDNLVELARRVYTRTLLRAATAGRGGRMERNLPKQIACEVLHGLVGYAMTIDELDRLLDGDDSLGPPKKPDEDGAALA